MIAPEHTMLLAQGWPELQRIVQEHPVDVLLVDPEPQGTIDVDMIIPLIEDFPSIAVVTYTVMTHAMVDTVFQLSKRGLHRTIFARFDDTRDRFALVLDALAPRRFVPLVLDALHAELQALPTDVARYVRELFSAPTDIHSVMHLAQRVRLSKPHLYRVFANAGLPSLRRLLAGARLAHVYSHLCDPGVTFQAAAAKVGYDDLRPVKRDVERAFHMNIPHLRHYTFTDDLVERLVCWIRKG